MAEYAKKGTKGYTPRYREAVFTPEWKEREIIIFLDSQTYRRQLELPPNSYIDFSKQMKVALKSISIPMTFKTSLPVDLEADLKVNSIDVNVKGLELSYINGSFREWLDTIFVDEKKFKKVNGESILTYQPHPPKWVPIEDKSTFASLEAYLTYTETEKPLEFASSVNSKCKPKLNLLIGHQNE